MQHHAIPQNVVYAAVAFILLHGNALEPHLL